MNFKQKIDGVALDINRQLNPDKQEMGFILIALPLGEDNPKSVWVSNMGYKDVISILKQTADKAKDNYLDNLSKLN